MDKTLLILDDEAPIRRMLHNVLKPEGYKCLSAAATTEAFQYLETEAIDLLLCDIHLAEKKTGLEFAQHVILDKPDIAVIIMTGLEDNVLVEKSLGMGVYDFITKPIEKKRLKISLSNAFHRLALEAESRRYRENLEELVTQRTSSLNKTLYELESAHERLSRSEDFFRTLVDNLPSVIYRGFSDWTFDFVDHKIVQLTGYSKADFEDQNKKWSDLILPEDLSGASSAIKSVLKADRSFVREYRIKHKSGNLLWFQDRGRIICDNNGRIDHISGVFFDITEQKELEAKLFQALEEVTRSHEETHQLINAMSTILINIDTNHRIRRINTAARQSLAITDEDVLGKSLFDCNLKWDHQRVKVAVSDCKTHRRREEIKNLEYFRSNGQSGFLKISVCPVCTANRLEGVLLLADDITEQKSLESQLSIAQKLESIGQLAAGIAHEINTPTQYVGDNLNFLKEAFEDIIGFCGRLESLVESGKDNDALQREIADIKRIAAEADFDFLKSEVPAALDQAFDGISRVAHIVRSIKQFAHPDDETQTEIDIHSALDNTITVASNEWKYVAEIEKDYDLSLPVVPCFPGELNQVFLNLIINAAHAIGDVSENGRDDLGKITIKTRKMDATAEICIKDTGTGIPIDIQDKIFDPFFTTKKIGKGTGQGLAISYRAINEKHGGTLTFETRPNQGTTFIVRLPLSRQQSERHE